jgi:hypothetical protein
VILSLKRPKITPTLRRMMRIQGKKNRAGVASERERQI